MKRLLPFLFLTLTACEVEESSTPKRGPHYEDLNVATVNLVKEQLRTITVPHVEFVQLPFQEALARLQQYSVDLSPDGKGIKFVVDWGPFNGQSDLPHDSESLMERPVRLNLKNVSLAEALSATAKQVDAKYVVEPFWIMFVPSSTPGRVYITREFLVPPSLLAPNPQENRIHLLIRHPIPRLNPIQLQTRRKHSKTLASPFRARRRPPTIRQVAT